MHNAQLSYVSGFEFLKREGKLFLLDKQTEVVLKIKELLFNDEFNSRQ